MCHDATNASTALLARWRSSVEANLSGDTMANAFSNLHNVLYNTSSTAQGGGGSSQICDLGEIGFLVFMDDKGIKKGSNDS